MAALGPGTEAGQLHSVLARQLKKLGVDADTPPTPEIWRKLLGRVDSAYQSSDRARYLSERSAELVSEEMQALHDRVLVEKQRIKSVTDSIGDGILGLDGAGKVRVINPSALRLLGRTEEEAIGRPVEEILGPVEHSSGVSVSIGPLIRHHLRASVRWSLEAATLQTSGGTRHVTMALSPDNPDEPNGLATLVLEDVTGEVEAEAERRQRRVLEGEIAQASNELAWAERRSTALVENVQDIIALIGPDLDFIWASPAMGRVLGYSPDDLPSDLSRLVHPDDIEALAHQFTLLGEEDGTHLLADARVLTAAGRYRWLELSLESHLGDPVLDGYVICARDIHSRVRQVELLRTQAAILELILSEQDLDTIMAAVAQGLLDSGDAVVAAALFTPGDPDRVAVARRPGHEPPPSSSRIWSDLCTTVPTGHTGVVDVDEHWDEHITNASLVGLRPLRASATTGPDGSAETLMVVYGGPECDDDEADISDVFLQAMSLAIANERHRLALRHQANYDPLTGLPNRWMLQTRLQDLIGRRRHLARPAAVLFVDLDDLKRVNDSLGHECGDDVLRAVADRLTTTLRSSDLLCRFGGDEFVVVCENLEDERNARWVAGRILEAMREPIDVADISAVVTASIGIAYLEAEYDEGDQLVRDADAAMYVAKAAGRNRFVEFDGTMRTRAVHRLQIETSLRRATDSDGIIAYYQPQFRPGDSRIVGFEALARWQDPDRGLRGPGDWLDVAEQSGLIVPVSEQVMNQACDLAVAIDREMPAGPAITVSANIAAAQLRDMSLVRHVRANLARTGIAPERLCLEITESSLADLEDSMEVLTELKAIGVRLSLDDWGTGYSSLEYLRELPVDELKVDQTFVRALDTHDGVRLVRGICQLGRALDLDLVAEGVETASQMGHVRAFRFDLVQGFLLAKPMPAVSFLELIRRQRQDAPIEDSEDTTMPALSPAEVV